MTAQDWGPVHDGNSRADRIHHKQRWVDVCYDRYVNAHAALMSANAEYVDAESAYAAAEAELRRELSAP